MGIAILRRAKHFIPADTLQMIYNALIQPYFDYCNPQYGAIVPNNCLIISNNFKIVRQE
jgi:hypothetical protein